METDTEQKPVIDLKNYAELVESMPKDPIGQVKHFSSCLQKFQDAGDRVMAGVALRLLERQVNSAKEDFEKHNLTDDEIRVVHEVYVRTVPEFWKNE